MGVSYVKPAPAGETVWSEAVQTHAAVTTCLSSSLLFEDTRRCECSSQAGKHTFTVTSKCVKRKPRGAWGCRALRLGRLCGLSNPAAPSRNLQSLTVSMQSSLRLRANIRRIEKMTN